MGSHLLADYFAGFSLTEEEKFVRSDENINDIKNVVEQRIRREYPQLNNVNISVDRIREIMKSVVNGGRVENKNRSRIKRIYPPAISAIVAQKIYGEYIIDIHLDNAVGDLKGFRVDEKSTYAMPSRIKSMPRLYAIAGQGDMNR